MMFAGIMTGRRRSFSAALIGLAASGLIAGAAMAQVMTPPRGSALRSAILDAVRPMVEAEVGKPVEFLVIDFNVLGDWAFVHVRPQRPGGGAIPYRYSRYADSVAVGAFEDTAAALLRNTPAGWLVYEYSLGATDVPWIGWWDYYGAPVQIFP